LNGLIGRTISHYTILEQIGQGGMSSVFRVADLTDGRALAMKVLSPYIAHEERFQARFEREIDLLTRLRHPNIIPILDFGEAEGLAFIVMPYIAGGTLLDRLNRGPLDPRQGGRIVEQLSSALMLAHQNGVIHRDVKPSNVLIDENGNALLSDFSFARPQDASQNLTGSALIGTPAYMSPEQCRGGAADPRSDQYSFAVMLFQITTGALPFVSDTPMATALQHMNVPLPRPRAVNPNLPEEVELVLIRALAKDPALRFESMEALNRSFQAALAVVLDPARVSAADGKTLSSQRSLAMYRKYQNVKPPERGGRFQRSAVLAALLLLLACTVSAGAVAVIYPEIFTPAAAAPSLSEADIQATVNVLLTANTSDNGTDLPPGVLETAVYAAVLQTIEASGAPTEPPGLSSDSLFGTPTSTVFGGLLFPTATPMPTRTYPPGVTPPTSTRTPTGPAGATATPPPTTFPSATLASSAEPTETEAPPPTATDDPATPTPSSTPTGCWPPASQQCRQTATALAAGATP